DIHLPGVSDDIYARMIGHLGPLLAGAPGFLSHAAGPADGGFHITELWRSEEEWSRFVEQHVAPAASAAGITPSRRVAQLSHLITPPHAGAPREGAPSSAGAPLLAADEGASFRVGPLTILVKEDGGRTRQTLAVAEFRGPRFRIPAHVHTEHD